MNNIYIYIIYTIHIFSPSKSELVSFGVLAIPFCPWQLERDTIASP